MSDDETGQYTDGREYTYWCPDCNSKFATDPVFCTLCGSWDTEEISECGIGADTDRQGGDECA